MKTLTTFRSLLALVALAATAPVVVSAQVRPTFYGQPVLDRTNELDAPGVDPALARIQQLAQSGLEWRDEAAQAGVTVQDGRVLVELSGASDLGIDGFSDSELVFSGDPTRVRAWFSPEVISDISGMRICRQPVANSYGAQANEAEEAMFANTYAASGLTGLSVRVAVIDLGFGGIDSIDEIGPIQQFQPGLASDAAVHGTAMIEAIRDIAPDAEISAIRLDANLDIIGATNLAIQAGARIIVCPLSWFGMPNEGQACEAAAMATDNGIMWINAAGNFADRRYLEGESAQSFQIGADTFVDFGGDPYQFINGMLGGEPFSVHFAAEGGLQLELYSWDGLSPKFVLIGQGDAAAIEQVVADVYVDGMYYFPMVRQLVPGELARFRMFAVGGDLHFNCVQGSIANPAAMPAVISVGAVTVNSYGQHSAPETYSSMGGGIFELTLTLCGPTGCTTATYGPQGFSGTSAAAANIAGLMALQLADPMLSADPLGFLQHVDIGGAEIVFALVDGFELDNDADAATQLGTAGGVSEGHLVSPSADQDWYSFTLDAASVVFTSAPGCTVEIYSADMDAALPSAEDGVRPLLPAGSYLVRVTADQITGYDLMVASVAAEPAQNELLIDDSAEADDSVDSDELLTFEVLSAGQPQQVSDDNAAGCAASSTTGLTAMLAALIVAAAIVRTRRKHA